MAYNFSIPTEVLLLAKQKLRGAGFWLSFLVAGFIHAAVFLLIVFTFPGQSVSARPVFIFLGSFLRAEDLLPVSSQIIADTTVQDSRNVNLDVRDGFSLNVFMKPSFVKKVSKSSRKQFKPQLDTQESSAKENKTSDDDLGLDLESYLPVRLKMER